MHQKGENLISSDTLLEAAKILAQGIQYGLRDAAALVAAAIRDAGKEMAQAYLVDTLSIEEVEQRDEESAEQDEVKRLWKLQRGEEYSE